MILLCTLICYSTHNHIILQLFPKTTTKTSCSIVLQISYMLVEIFWPAVPLDAYSIEIKKIRGKARKRVLRMEVIYGKKDDTRAQLVKEDRLRKFHQQSTIK
ncbi:uncharacterized protein LOC132606784 [Lycium barbarum]|uniref:uncharacterized protein LOC132606784 n=1 Tax=Lycium barbarum TaxID=112863 RepID=UPI00293E024B|nr:uncharacterized protein LOC132606784 [Lycium barbarum]